MWIQRYSVHQYWKLWESIRKLMKMQVKQLDVSIIKCLLVVTCDICHVMC